MAAQHPAPDRLIVDIDRIQHDVLAQGRRVYADLIFQLSVGAALLFYVFHPSGYDPRVYLLAAAAFAGAWGLHGRLLTTFHAVNAALLSALALFVWVASQTGGVNSSKNLWFSLLPLAALLTVGRAAGLWWLGVVALAQVLLMALGLQGYIDTHVHTQHMLAWVVLNQACVLLAWMLGVYLYEKMYRQQVQANEQHNQNLLKTHEDLLLAQAHKEEFMASVGHELRTPMNAILGFNGILRSELEDRPQDVAVVDLIRQSTERLLQVVNDILDYSQLQAGRLVLHPQTIDVAHTITTALRPDVARAQAKGLDMQIDIAPSAQVWVQADRQRLIQILSNLVDNAIKFTHHGRVVVSVSRVAGELEVVVQDTGIGIAPDRQQVIFDRFEHANIQTNRQFGGTGLGISICERLVALQGGSVGLTSQMGEGTRFWLRLPLPVVEAPSVASPRDVDLTQEPLRFLLVDDNAVNLMVAGLMLKKSFPNASVEQAQSGEQALALLRSQAFDLVLMDMMMPGMDGLEATRLLRSTFAPPVRDMPVLALTASVNPVDRERCLASGMNDVLYKPLDPGHTVAQISRQVLNHRHKGSP